MFVSWVVFHVLVCIALILVVLLQASKGEGLAGSAFGGGGGIGGAVFGGRGAASFLSRATTVLAVVFMLNCGALAFMSAGGRGGQAEVGTQESAVTRQAQADMEEAMRRQQEAQQQQTGDTSQQVLDLLQESAPTAEPSDTGN